MYELSPGTGGQPVGRGPSRRRDSAYSTPGSGCSGMQIFTISVPKGASGVAIEYTPLLPLLRHS